MKRVMLLSVILALVISLAAPTGAVFASDELAEPTLEEVEMKEKIEPRSETETETEVAPQLPVESPVEELTDDSVLVAEASPLITKESPSVVTLAEESPIIEVETPAPPMQTTVPPQRKVYVTAFQTTNALGFVELYNGDTKTQSIGSWRLVADFVDDEPLCEVQLSGYIFPKTKVLLASDTMQNVNNALAYSCGHSSRVLTALTLYDGDQMIERLVPPKTDDQIWVRKNTTSTYLTGTFLQDFKADEQYVVTDGFWYIVPAAPSVQVLEVYVNPRVCVPPDDSAACYDYIKIKNTSDEHTLDLGDYRLRSGYSNTTASASNTTYSSVVLDPGEIATLTHDQFGDRISFTANDGTVWFEDAEGVISYPTNVPPYIGSNAASKKGRSWAYNGETQEWQWATPTPFAAENDFTPLPEPGRGSAGQPRELVPCREGQYRSEETNRCRNIATANTLTPCREGQYRSEETNRCRSIATAAASVLKPCADDQFRNPATNRCKKIASADDVALADCGEGRERNPATNRCRNVVAVAGSSDTLPFAVEPTDTDKETFAAWWALGAVAAAGAGYGIWEWRYELASAVRRLARSGPK